MRTECLEMLTETGLLSEISWSEIGDLLSNILVMEPAGLFHL